MATFNEKYRGYQWEDSEREERKDPVRRVRNELGKIEEQVRRIKSHLTPFAAAAERAWQPLSGSFRTLSDLNLTNQGPKYLPFSPEEVDRLLAAIPEQLMLWQELMASPDYRAAVRQLNRDIRKKNAQVRAHNQAVRADQRAMWDKMDVVLRQMDAGDLGGALDKAAELGLL